MHVSTHIHTHTYSTHNTHTSTSTHTHTRPHIHIHTHVHTHTHVHAHTHAYTRTPTYTRTETHYICVRILLGFMPIHRKIENRSAMFAAMKVLTDQVKMAEPPKRFSCMVSGRRRQVGLTMILLSGDTPARCAMQQRSSHSSSRGCGTCGAFFPSRKSADYALASDISGLGTNDAAAVSVTGLDYYTPFSKWSTECPLQNGVYNYFESTHTHKHTHTQTHTNTNKHKHKHMCAC